MDKKHIYAKLQCNHLMNPLGIMGDRVTLSFWEKDNIFNCFWLGMASTKEKLDKSEYDILYVKYEYVTEIALDLQAEAGKRIFWHIKNEEYISETAYFDFAEIFTQAKWISVSQTTEEICLFNKKFNLDAMPVRAKLIVCGLGFFDGEINGEKIDNNYFKPNFTDYKKRTDNNFVQKNKYYAVYNTYDVLHLLVKGENEMRFNVSGGYFHNTDRYDAPVWNYGDIRLKFELILYDSNGETRIVSDEDCLVAKTGNKSTLYLGDRIDFQKRDIQYEKAYVLEEDIILRPTTWKDDVLVESLSPRCIKETDNCKIYDFGKNHTGGICCLLSGAKGTKVTVRYAEIMNEDGSLNFNSASFEEFVDVNNIPETFEEQLKAKKRVGQENTYILSGEKDKVEPLFSWRCYRYVEMKADDAFSVDNLSSSFICMDIDKIGEFSCAEPIFNDIYEKYILTQLDNLHCGVATDCPHREKVAYTGDGHLTATSVLYNFDAEGFYNKWLTDIIYSQSIDGFVPNSAPDMATGGGYFWGFAIMRLPEILYRYTGNMEYLQRAYHSMMAWISYMNTRHNGDYILFVDDRKWLLSDWLSPEEVKINCRYFSTVCFYASVKTICEVHRILFRENNEYLEMLARNIRKAINATFFNKENFCYSNGIQGETVLALHYGIPEEEYVQALREQVRKHYTETTNGHFDTGIIMAPILLQYLTENGMNDIAYRLMTQVDYPSFAYMLKGETTIPEHWSKHWISYSFSDNRDFVVSGGDDVSHCHPMYGSVVEWLYEKVAGLDLSKLYNGIVRITPSFIKQIPQAKASVLLRKGKVAVVYENENKLFLKVSIPETLQGELYIDDLYGSFEVKGKENYSLVADGSLELKLSSGDWIIQKI